MWASMSLNAVCERKGQNTGYRRSHCRSQFPELRNARQNAGERDLHDPKNTTPLAASTNSDTRIQDAIPAFDCCVEGVKRGMCETLRLVCPTRRDTPK